MAVHNCYIIQYYINIFFLLLDNCIYPGGDFLIKFVRVNSQGVGERCYFATSADGKPVKLQRKPYTECFYIMALTELYRATENQRYQVSSVVNLGWSWAGPDPSQPWLVLGWSRS